MTLTCRVQEHGGVPTAFADGHPLHLLAYKSGPQDLATYSAFAAAGYNVAFANIKLGMIWLGPDRLDYASLHRAMGTILQADSQAYVILEWHINAPEWWLDSHPEEVQVDRSGQHYGQSLASVPWREETRSVLAACVREAEAHYGDRIVLYLVGAGHTWEWFYRTPLRYVADSSLPMRRAFAGWLLQRYGSLDQLQQAWRRKVLLDEVEVPEWPEVIEGALGSLRDPERQRPVMDFFLFYNQLPVHVILDFARTLKEACSGRKLFGVFYGHLLDWLDNPLTAQHSGHLGLSTLLESDLVDVLAGPNSYMNRDLGHESSFVCPVDSVRLHGKLWLAETDTRTSLASPVQDCCGRPSSIEESLVVLRRDFCHALIRGVDMAWFSLFGGWYDDERIMVFMADARRIAHKAFSLSRAPVAEVAALVDERSPLALTGRDAYRVDPFLSSEPRASDMLAHLGFPCDLYLLTDLGRMDLSRYRMLVMVNPVWLSAEQRRLIQERVCQDGRVVVWLGTPGLVQETVSVDHLSALIGMHARLIGEPAEIFIRMRWGSHPITQKVGLGVLQPFWVDGDFEGHFGTNQILSPRVSIEDASATSLGVYSRDGTVGFAVKDLGTWRSVFIGAPYAPPAVLRQIGRWAGVHVYNQTGLTPLESRDELVAAGWTPDEVHNPADDILYVNDDFLALHVKFPGRRRIVLPEKRTVVEVFQMRLAGEQVKEFEVECAGPGTFLFYIGARPWEEVCE